MVKLPKNHFKRVISSVLACAMSATILPYFPVNAEETVEKYPYTMFAASNSEGAITVNAGNFCLNGNIATNGTIVSSGNVNINGTRTEQANEEMLYIFDKIDAKYFTGSNVEEYTEDYTLEEMNININNPVEVEGDATLTGNININSALKAFENVELYGEVKNTNDSLIYSKYGDIIIESQNVNLNGLVYAPFGDVVVTAQNLNLNNVVIIADTITFECPSVNANYSSSVAAFVGSVSEPLDIPYEEWQYMKDENENDFPDFFEECDNWKYLKDSNGDYTPDCIQNYLDGIDTSKDTDEDGIPDWYEIIICTSIEMPDSDCDGLTDFQEVNYYNTNPLMYDSDGDGVSDGDEDFDKDELNNIIELELGTDPLVSDTDNDGLNDNVEVTCYQTNPLFLDSDFDGLSDYDEIIMGFDPNQSDTNADGTADGDESVEQVVSENNIAQSLLIGNEAIPSLCVTTNGNVNSIIGIKEYSGSELSDSRAVIGKPIEINNATFTEGVLSFNLGEKINKFIDDSSIPAYVICKYNMLGDLEYLTPTYDYSTSSISTMINEAGVYYVLDVEILFNEYGIEYSTVTQNSMKETSLLSSRSITNDSVTAQADIVFIIDTTGSMGSVISNVKKNIISFVDSLKSYNISPSFSLVTFEDITHDGLGSTKIINNGFSNWYMSATKFKDAIGNLNLGDGGDIPETVIDGLECARSLDLRPSSNKFFIVITDAAYKVNNQYGIASMEEEINLLKDDGICTSIVTGTNLEEAYESLYKETGGIIADVNSPSFEDELLKLVNQINETINSDGEWIYLKGNFPTPIKVNEHPTEGSTVDTDEDGIPDCKELKSTVPDSYFDFAPIFEALGIKVSDMISLKVPVYDYISDPSEPDTDGDGYDDFVDLNPRVEYKTPVVLIHGRNDNTNNCFGADSWASSGNKHYNSEETLNGGNYTSIASQLITYVHQVEDPDKKEQTNLAYELDVLDDYERNLNLFAFNYPNQDMTKINATKLEEYLENLSMHMSAVDVKYFYPTQEAADMLDFKVILIGHSNGGLVSRYYIENLGHSDNVERLITIDTPHWGSVLADFSDNLLALPSCYPMDVDLNPDNAIFGGTYKKYYSLNPFVQDKIKYINENQTDELKYYFHGETKYDLLAGYDATSFNDVPIIFLNNDMYFDVAFSNITNFAEFSNEIFWGFKNNCTYGNEYSLYEMFDIGRLDGDNVVDNPSQFGVQFNSDDTLNKRITASSYWMNIDTIMGHNSAVHFHGQMPHRSSTCDKIVEILQL